ncbi:hypothetical protein P153DRAFT_363433 [Dothidotthia symphoricarpi CBS 119687]|uniref:Uncharacterized protein n=1 Tax=Dothidotthia symphoricarpi CBS 119687 TaxID=1392245 RepID=A0A6A6AN60_9PLEO|nr:uncharacterized protein P153DRAFT_363433 [Dothidotthia symphoricarpi CBS 119687]KAF2133220.1 hypothetical protein P153DRAFT_363433 [Dothidotthia symphoricarpi CBS 119687]
MLFNSRYFALATIISTLANGLPLDAPRPRDIIPRAKSYTVINVDGGSSTEAPPQTTSVAEQETKTVEVTNPGPTVTQKVTATVVEPVPAPVSTGSSSTTSISSRSASTAIETPKPSVITIVVTKGDGPTDYYDNGMWHTNYRIKTLEAAVTTFATSTLTSTSLPVLETLNPSA